MKPHLAFAQSLWKNRLNVGDQVIDATCGNGKDTLVLAGLCLSPTKGKLYTIDIQIDAIEKSRRLLKEHLDSALMERITFIHGSHAAFPEEIAFKSVKAVIYNLGYLPGGDKSKTTLYESTIESLSKALILIQDDGFICVTCYPGHAEGKKEEEKVLQFASELDSKDWECSHHRWINRKASPNVLIISRL